MNAVEQSWFGLGLGGLLLSFTGAVGWITSELARISGKESQEDWAKIIVGFVILLLAIFVLWPN